MYPPTLYLYSYILYNIDITKRVKAMKKELCGAEIIIGKSNFSEKGYTKNIINEKADEVVNSSLKAFEYMAKIQNTAKDEREGKIIKRKNIRSFSK